MESLKLRENWSAEPWDSSYKGRFLALAYENRGGVTLDFEMRVFRVGWCSHGPSHKPNGMNGRGWRQRLADAAMRWLEDVFLDHPGTNTTAQECSASHDNP